MPTPADTNIPVNLEPTATLIDSGVSLPPVDDTGLRITEDGRYRIYEDNTFERLD
jgi:hypothetical protein